MSDVVRVRAPVRIHFGMFSFGRSDSRQFGGVGLMIEPPSVQITVRPATRFTTSGPLTERAETAAMACCRTWELADLPDCEIIVDDAPESHVGLGVGTQLSLAVATGLARFLNRRVDSTEELAAAAGRGLRSAVGTYGFLQGGLIVDAGKRPQDMLGKLEVRRAIPDEWRVVLIRSQTAVGLSGQHETEAFARLPPVPVTFTDALWNITRSEMLPALERGDVRAFGEAVYRFGVLAGSAFAAVQGGPFASRRSAELVTAIREFGVPGVGQSSWGPTLFAICADQGQAESLVEWAVNQQGVREQDASIALPNNLGALIDLAPGSTPPIVP